MNNEHEQLQDYLDEVEKQWRGSQSRFTDEFLLETFPEVLEDIPAMLEELSQKRSALMSDIVERLEPYTGRSDIDSMFARECVKHFLVVELLRLEGSITFLERLVHHNDPAPSKYSSHFAPDEIQRARDMSIIDVAERLIGELRKMGKSFLARCPFHEEKTPSFHLYADSNRFHCFGCASSGDVIDLVQKILGLSFPQTISYLLRK